MNRQILNYTAPEDIEKYPEIDPEMIYHIQYPEAIVASHDMRWNTAERRVLAKIAAGGDDVIHEHWGSGRIVRVAGERISFFFHASANGGVNINRWK
jgi:hypothetical protein